jgi:hypothetical protein
MVQVYKLPIGISIETMRTLQGAEGSRLNPIQDTNGNWIISQEEYNAAEFQHLVTEYPDVYAAMQLIDYEPVITELPVYHLNTSLKKSDI